MSRKPHGSAAVRAKRMPESAVKASVTRCINDLGHALDVARIAQRGPEPARAAIYIILAIDALDPELRLLRRASRQS